MIRSIVSMYSWRFPAILTYMLQNTEYHAGPYLKWLWRTTHFERVMYRRTLQPTRIARLILLVLRWGMAVQILAAVSLIYLWLQGDVPGGLAFGLALLVAYPLLWGHLVVMPLVLGRVLVIWPRQWLAVRAARPIFAQFRGPKIAVAGSYGKTSMKELLVTVLSEGKKVAATPANLNVAISHARFARTLKGDEDVLVIEFGESAPGDVARFTANTTPTHAVITGIAPAHLDRYRTLKAAAKDIFSVARTVAPQHVYVNGESSEARPYVQPGMQQYSQQQALGWKIQGIRVNFDGVRFTMQKGAKKLDLASGLLGRHQVGPLAFVAALAYELGLTPRQIKAGIAKTAPFEHRMQPAIIGGAWVIDDTYNGNIEGIRVGTELLKELPAKRKIYVTPGLVDQGGKSADIHETMGRLIAAAEPDMVVLMKHSVTKHIQRGLEAAGFQGELLIETDPLNFYSNLQLFVAVGDVVLMQNDWPDNYA